MEKYIKTQKECKRLTEENKELEIKQKAKIEEKIMNLQNNLENANFIKEKLSKENKELESQFKQLMEKSEKISESLKKRKVKSQKNQLLQL